MIIAADQLRRTSTQSRGGTQNRSGFRNEILEGRNRLPVMEAIFNTGNKEQK
jgi:hypothetical protein